MAFDPNLPPGTMRTMARGRFNNQIEREGARVRRAGKRLLVLRPTGDELSVHGVNLLSARNNDRIEQAAFEATSQRLTDAAVRRLIDQKAG